MDGVLALILILAVGATVALVLDFTILVADSRRARRRAPFAQSWRDEYLVGQPLVSIESTPAGEGVRMRLVPMELDR